MSRKNPPFTAYPAYYVVTAPNGHPLLQTMAAKRPKAVRRFMDLQGESAPKWRQYRRWGFAVQMIRLERCRNRRLSDDRVNPYLDPEYVSRLESTEQIRTYLAKHHGAECVAVFDDLAKAGMTCFDEASSVTGEQIKAILDTLKKLGPSAPIQTKPGPNWLHKPLEHNERKIVRAIADFKTLTTWISERCFDLEACWALCVAAIESLEAKTG